MGLFSIFAKTPKGPVGKQITVTTPMGERFSTITVNPPRGPVGRALLAKKPIMARATTGLRGAAMETITHFPEGQTPHSDMIGADEFDAFMTQGAWLTVNSSWIEAGHYDRDAGTFTMRVKKTGREYTFPNCSEQEAYEWAIAVSKGGAVWDLFWKTKIDWSRRVRVPR